MAAATNPTPELRATWVRNLQRGDEIRMLRAQLKRDIKAGRANAVDYLLSPPEFALNMDVFDLLLAMPGKGRVRVAKLLTRHRISHTRAIGSLTERERRLLARELS